MPRFTIDDFARTAVGAATNKADDSLLSPQQVSRVTSYLNSPGSLPDDVNAFSERTSSTGNMRYVAITRPDGLAHLGPAALTGTVVLSDGTITLAELSVPDSAAERVLQPR